MASSVEYNRRAGARLAPTALGDSALVLTSASHAPCCALKPLLFMSTPTLLAVHAGVRSLDEFRTPFAPPRFDTVRSLSPSPLLRVHITHPSPAAPCARIGQILRPRIFIDLAPRSLILKLSVPDAYDARVSATVVPKAPVHAVPSVDACACLLCPVSCSAFAVYTCDAARAVCRGGRRANDGTSGSGRGGLLGRGGVDSDLHICVVRRERAAGRRQPSPALALGSARLYVALRLIVWDMRC
ncbi:hypothetical protein C8R45DRAFT_1186209 [Mycena sanguinolenta]|nr:hypothetical protein C8R45DRAFT_1186209 [Mycena sanguinolenta]